MSIDLLLEKNFQSEISPSFVIMIPRVMASFVMLDSCCVLSKTACVLIRVGVVSGLLCLWNVTVYVCTQSIQEVVQ